jgi:hypothetical protein
VPDALLVEPAEAAGRVGGGAARAGAFACKMVTLSRVLYNPELPWLDNAVLFWAWESVVHHVYFLVLFVQRQLSETWSSGELWRLNMEKECAFFSNLFGGNPTLCAESTMTLFSGIWFGTPRPSADQLNWIGRIVTNYQHSEAMIHSLICLSGLLLIAKLSDATAKHQRVAGWLKWSFFASLFFETWTMCVPYLVLFGWAWSGVTPSPRSSLADTLAAMGQDPFLDGVQMGAALITMFWVSVTVLILDAWAMFRAWQYAMDGRDTLALNVALYGGLSAALLVYLHDFFESNEKGFTEPTIAVRSLDLLHGLFGNDSRSMLTVSRAAGTSI